MKKLITLVFLMLTFVSVQIIAQEAYWTESWNNDTLTNKLTGSSGSVFTDWGAATAESGEWLSKYAYRGGSYQCDGHGRTLRLMKGTDASTQGGAITPSLDMGVSKVSFVEGRGGTNRVILISKTTDEGLSWEIVDTLNGTVKCDLNEFTVNDEYATELKFENIGTGDCDIDSITVYKYVATPVEEPAPIPTSFALDQNYPNPFNPATLINYSVPKQGHVTIKVFDQLGKEVAVLVDGQIGAGRHELNWDASKSGLASGVYVITMRAGDFVKSVKAVLMK